VLRSQSQYDEGLRHGVPVNKSGYIHSLIYSQRRIRHPGLSALSFGS
jgi:hypothetical protein